MREDKFFIKASYLELYNENIVDLLNKDSKNLQIWCGADGVSLKEIFRRRFKFIWLHIRGRFNDFNERRDKEQTNWISWDE
jgi:hypothetical protein